MPSHARFIIQGFHGSLPSKYKDSLSRVFSPIDANTWFYDGEWNTFVSLLGQKFLAYHRPESDEWHIYVTSYPHFAAR